MTAKDRMRAQMRAVRAARSPAIRALQSGGICERLLGEAFYAEADVVAAYLALRSEADPVILMRAAHAEGKRVVVPRMEPGGGLSLRVWTPDAVLVQGAFGVPEPTVGAERLAPGAVDLVVVPGLAFDPRGTRLGYGKGFYDRLLPQMPQAVRVGMAFDEQIVEQVPREAHDIAMQWVAGTTVLHRCVPPT